jgi:peroxiredoxin Q/BCP
MSAPTPAEGATVTAPRTGLPAPAFTLPATGGQSLSLHEFKGKNLVLYFYPRDSTPGCTTEGQEFRDLYPAFQRHNTAILGVSRDSLKAHENFKAKQGFPFELLSDQEERLCRLFAVIKEKNMYGKMVQGIERSTFLIDASGVLRQEWRKVKVAGHAAAVLDAVKQL